MPFGVSVLTTFKKSSNINGLRVAKKQYLPTKLNNRIVFLGVFHKSGHPANKYHN